MGVPDVEQAKKRLQDILRRAQKLEIPTQEVISTRTARKLLARTRNVLAWTIWIGVFVVLLSGVVYARWPTRQDVETVRTVLRRTVQILSKDMFLPGIEPGTFRVLGGCDNHYTTETLYILQATT
ncbi:PREDICTED: uncharacterized protein LOC105457844 isoform X1 [Wasmannia auropunctata]|uniref:uncharacterized protein LOC105457844 isoform X1 n=1 Tax=Wasmannia auropunctata TaxID=64793 RepID=UPI0005EEDB07|nr:PREDICTED: uncharacterized protein LOC105457844 isoform X1 [Wasmannia auropunctata]